MRIKGIKRGQTIELLEAITDIPDGTEIVINLAISSPESVQVKSQLTDEERLIKLNQLFGAWSNQPELTEIFTEIDQ